MKLCNPGVWNGIPFGVRVQLLGSPGGPCLSSSYRTKYQIYTGKYCY